MTYVFYYLETHFDPKHIDKLVCDFKQLKHSSKNSKSTQN
jgi:hypothetical protein